MGSTVVVVGDVLLDRDIHGEINRSCEDGAAPVLDTNLVDERPGGAGLAALLAARAGADVVLVAPFGTDSAGARVRNLLEGLVEVVALPGAGPTPIKSRVQTTTDFLVRIDEGGPCEIGIDSTDVVATALARADAVLVSDYGQGMTSAPWLRALLESVTGRRPVLWDPHPQGTEPIPGLTVVTPNESEALAVGGSPDGAGRLARVRSAADIMLEKLRATALAVTLAGDGALLSFGYGAPLLAPAPMNAVGDACGAGDCLAAHTAIELAGGGMISQAVVNGVGAASEFVATGGVRGLGEAADPVTGSRRARQTVRRVREGGGTLVATGGCFDLLHPGHVSMLRHARSLGDGLVVLLNSDDSVRTLKGPDRPVTSQSERRAVLEALEAVDAVVLFDDETPAQLLTQLRPDIWVKGGDYAGSDLPEIKVVREYGGEVVVVPYLEGHSTTGLIRTAGERSSQ